VGAYPIKKSLRGEQGGEYGLISARCFNENASSTLFEPTSNEAYFKEKKKTPALHIGH
jgi:hypothetical protein